MSLTMLQTIHWQYILRSESRISYLKTFLEYFQGSEIKSRVKTQDLIDQSHHHKVSLQF